MKLLVSVRSVEEAEAALTGGAGLIDVKEPARGPLGRADDAVVAAVVQYVGPRRPVSAACGELLAASTPMQAAGPAYVKWGLAGCGARLDWRRRLELVADQWRRAHPNCRPVVSAYADWQRAESPSPNDVCSFVCDHGWPVFLLDTWNKDDGGLLRWLTFAQLQVLLRRCRTADVQIALAGSLGLEQIASLRILEPDWFAVRGAACRQGRREAEIDADAVQRLVLAIKDLEYC